MAAATATSRTQPGRRVVNLVDGSHIHLNVRSAIRTNLTAYERRMRLFGGEAFLAVTAAPTRPFAVEADTAVVRLLGATLNVEVDEASVMVAVANGRVSLGVEDTRVAEQLTAGQAIEVDLQTGEFRCAMMAADHVAAWQEGLLIVENRTVGAVFAELRRYHWGYILLDNDLAAKTISGGIDYASYRFFALSYRCGPISHDWLPST